MRTHCKKGHALTEDNIYDRGGRAHGRECRRCRNDRKLKYNKTHQSQQTVNMRHWRASHPVQALMTRYGASASQYQTFLEQQNGRCAICKEKKKLEVDHDHATGNVRGLLCHGCNAGIGRLRDSPVLLINALAYLQGIEIP